MDLDSLRTDLNVALKQLPPDMLSELSGFVLRHKETFGTVIPALMENLFPHIKAGMMEKAMGILDLKEVEGVIMDVLKENGVKPEVRGIGGFPLNETDEQKVPRKSWNP